MRCEPKSYYFYNAFKEKKGTFKLNASGEISHQQANLLVTLQFDCILCKFSQFHDIAQD